MCHKAWAQPINENNRFAAMDTIREVSITPTWGSAPDTVPHKIDWHLAASYRQPFPFHSLILPAAMIAYGATAVHNGTLQKVNSGVKDQIWEDNPHKPMHVDNYLMFAPTLSVYALNAAGIHGAHNFKDRTAILLMANVIANGTVFSVKGWSHEMRPDGSDHASFPSGHTAEAFVGAEFMRLEYKDVSPWYGVAGYAMATATGVLRMYNDKHWLSDVVAGAGVGIASTRIAYWLYPKIQGIFGKPKNPEVVNVVMPTYNNGSFGLSWVKRF
ncbi:MAG TPA: phosphatase PAP2 family protein [Puia sp.]|uniref:phosphatase PAP2 family protein n=1 Tax=Puia sp. TaxID=2045100 RepID=UPI002B6AA504|nr:phosphatase PAP2 family protein [Puia sp.]HVU95741.1 phosphatase PAP2 family protein [Puia sp.]